MVSRLKPLKLEESLSSINADHGRMHQMHIRKHMCSSAMPIANVGRGEQLLACGLRLAPTSLATRLSRPSSSIATSNSLIPPAKEKEAIHVPPKHSVSATLNSVH